MSNPKPFRVIDAHAHIFPDKVAERAVQSIGGYYNLPMSGSGTVDGLIKSGEAMGVSHYLVHSTATRPEQVDAINAYISATCAADSRLIGFGTLHPDVEDLPASFENLRGLGLKGIKLHPEFQNFNLDDAVMMPIYAIAEGKLPLLIHMGDENRDSSTPERLANVLDRFPNLTVIAAHLGGYQMWEQAAECLAGRRIYLDTSSSLAFMTPEAATALIRRHGATKILFGTDYPMWLHQEELERLHRLDLSDEERERILWRNAAELLGLGIDD